MSQVERRLSLNLRVSRFKPTCYDSITPSTSVVAMVLAICCRSRFLAEASRYEDHLCRAGC